MASSEQRIRHVRPGDFERIRPYLRPTEIKDQCRVPGRQAQCSNRATYVVSYRTELLMCEEDARKYSRATGAPMPLKDDL